MMETVRSIVEAFAAGKIELKRGEFDPNHMHGIKIVPNFARRAARRAEEVRVTPWYTVISIGKFLDRTGYRKNGEERASGMSRSMLKS